MRTICTAGQSWGWAKLYLCILVSTRLVRRRSLTNQFIHSDMLGRTAQTAQRNPLYKQHRPFMRETDSFDWGGCSHPSSHPAGLGPACDFLLPFRCSFCPLPLPLRCSSSAAFRESVSVPWHCRLQHHPWRLPHSRQLRPRPALSGLPPRTVPLQLPSELVVCVRRSAWRSWP